MQQEISRDVAQAVERADFEGLLSEPDIQKFYAGGACTRRVEHASSMAASTARASGGRLG